MTPSPTAEVSPSGFPPRFKTVLIFSDPAANPEDDLSAPALDELASPPVRGIAWGRWIAPRLLNSHPQQDGAAPVLPCDRLPFEVREALESGPVQLSGFTSGMWEMNAALFLYWYPAPT